MPDPADLGVLEAAALLRARELSSLELTEACLRRIDERNGGAPSYEGAPDAINAWVRLYPDLAREQARAADERLGREGEDAPLLCGIPLAIKDLYGVEGLPLTASSRVLEGNVAERRRGGVAAPARRGHGAAGPHAHPRVRRRRDHRPGRQPVGARRASPAGRAAAAPRRWRRGWRRRRSAATRAARCGSRRRAAAPARSSPPTGGSRSAAIIPLAASLDHPGPMARTIADCAAVLAAMAAGGARDDAAHAAAGPMGELPLAARPGPRPLEGVTIALTERPDGGRARDEVAAASTRRAAPASGWARAWSSCARPGPSTGTT